MLNCHLRPVVKVKKQIINNETAPIQNNIVVDVLKRLRKDFDFALVAHAGRWYDFAASMEDSEPRASMSSWWPRSVSDREPSDMKSTSSIPRAVSVTWGAFLEGTIVMSYVAQIDRKRISQLPKRTKKAITVWSKWRRLRNEGNLQITARMRLRVDRERRGGWEGERFWRSREGMR